MTATNAVILGIVQGIAEFLPISSSGHLVIFRNILGLGDIPPLFDVILHCATMLVVVFVFRDRIWAILKAVWRFAAGAGRHGRAEAGDRDRDNLRLAGYIIVATAITGAIGIAIEKLLPPAGVRTVSLCMLATSAILGTTALVKPGKRSLGEMGLPRAVFIGLAQGIGVLSGVSRSGISISAGVFSGLERGAAGEFSFVLSVPAVLGALLLTLKDSGAMMEAVSAGPLVLAFAVSLVAGYVSLKLLMKLIRKGKLAFFALYLLAVGIAGLVMA